MLLNQDYAKDSISLPTRKRLPAWISATA